MPSSRAIQKKQVKFATSAQASLNTTPTTLNATPTALSAIVYEPINAQWWLTSAYRQRNANQIALNTGQLELNAQKCEKNSA